MSSSSPLSNYLTASFLLFLLIPRRRQRHLEKFLFPIPTPSVPLLNNDGSISPYLIIRNPIHLLQGHKIHTHELFTYYLPAYPSCHHQLQPQLRWGKQWFSRVCSCTVLYILDPPGASIRKKSWESWGIGLPTLPTPPPTKTIQMTMKNSDAMGGGTGSVSSIRGIWEDDPPSLLLLRWREMSCTSSREGGSHAPCRPPPPTVLTPPNLRIPH